MAQTMAAPVTPTPVMTALISAIREIVAARSDPDRTATDVAAVLAPALTRDDLLDLAQCEPDPNCYRQHILHVEPDGSFSIVALVWLPGQATPIHDHVCWCVVDVHRVANAGGGLAISLHVYGADIGVLGSSVRRRYELPVAP